MCSRNKVFVFQKLYTHPLENTAMTFLKWNQWCDDVEFCTWLNKLWASAGLLAGRVALGEQCLIFSFLFIEKALYTGVKGGRRGEGGKRKKI